MNSYWSRLSQLTSVYIFGLFVCGFWTYLGGKAQEWSIGLSRSQLPSPIQSIGVTKFGFHPLTTSDAASLSLSVEVDLRPAFTWSTNALFVYISLEYATAYRPRNEVVIWDRVVTEKEDALIRVENVKSKYLLQDFSKGHMANNTITATFHYYQMPKTGFFHKFMLGDESAFKMPVSYTQKGRIRA